MPDGQEENAHPGAKRCCNKEDGNGSMHTYKVLLVDDEPEIREGLQEVVDFAALGFAVVGEAGNGRDAIALAEATAPDLIITDIRMPLMDGLAMAAHIRVQMPTVQFVILSGYDEFEYARQAIEITALRYLLKPITSEEFIEVMRDVHARMDEEFERRRDITRLKAHLEHSLPVLRERLLYSLLLGEMPAGQALQTAARYGMRIESGGYLLGLLRAAYGDGPSAPGLDDPELLTFAITNIAGEVMGEHLPHYLLRHEDTLALLMLLPDAGAEAVAKGMAALEAVRGNVQYYLDCPIYIGVSAPCAHLAALPGCVRQAQAALNHAGLMEQGQVLGVGDIAPGSSDTVAADAFALRQLGNSLKRSDAQGAREAVRAVLDAFRDQGATMQEYRACLLELMLVFIRVGRDMHIPLPEEAQQEMIDQLRKCPPLPQAAQTLCALCDRFAADVASSRATSSRLLAEQAAEYLQQAYAREDMSIERVAQHLHISPSYCSALFKKEMGKTLLQYITELRMDRAMTLLAASPMRTAEIAQAVGIADPGYFSYAFKRHFGMSPSQVRKKAGAKP